MGSGISRDPKKGMRGALGIPGGSKKGISGTLGSLRIPKKGMMGALELSLRFLDILHWVSLISFLKPALLLRSL